MNLGGEQIFQESASGPLSNEWEGIFLSYLGLQKAASDTIGDFIQIDDIIVRGSFLRFIKEYDENCLSKMPGEHGVGTCTKFLQLFTRVQSIKSKIIAEQSFKFESIRQEYIIAHSYKKSIPSIKIKKSANIYVREFGKLCNLFTYQMKSADDIEKIPQSFIFSSDFWKKELISTEKFIENSNTILEDMARVVEHKEKIIGDRNRESFSRWSLIIAIFGLFIVSYSNAFESINLIYKHFLFLIGVLVNHVYPFRV